MGGLGKVGVSKAVQVHICIHLYICVHHLLLMPYAHKYAQITAGHFVVSMREIE